MTTKKPAPSPAPAPTPSPTPSAASAIADLNKITTHGNVMYVPPTA